jgi:hypothetical protein
MPLDFLQHPLLRAWYFNQGRTSIIIFLPSNAAFSSRCTIWVCHVTNSCTSAACVTSRWCSPPQTTGRRLPGSVHAARLRAAALTARRVLANYAWKMLVFSDAVERWQHVMWLDAGQELRAAVDGVRATLHTTGPALNNQIKT